MLPYTIKAVRKSDKEDLNGLAPIKIKVYIKGHTPTYISIGKKVKEINWDESGVVKKNLPNHNYLNTIIRNKIAEVEEVILRECSTSGEVSISRIRSILNGSNSKSFFTYAREYIKQVKGIYSPDTIQNYNNAVDKLEDYVGRDIVFSDIDHAFLRKYESYLRQKGKDGEKEIGYENNTVHKHWKYLKKIFNSAIKDKVTQVYPFQGYANPKYIQTDRTWLTEEEVNRVEGTLDMPLTDQQRKSVIYFLLGCFSGLRVSDWLRFNPKFIQGDRLILRAQKNGKLVSMPIHPRLRSIIDKCLEVGALNFDPNEHLKAIGTLAKLDKVLTNHVARHAYGVRCAELGISIETTAHLMGITVKTCKVYYKVTDRKIDNEVAIWNQLA